MLEAHITHDQFSIFLCYFSDHSGSPFGDFGPDPVCMPDPDMEDYGDEEGVVYNVVSNPTLKFEENEFHVFSPLRMLCNLHPNSFVPALRT